MSNSACSGGATRIWAAGVLVALGLGVGSRAAEPPRVGAAVRVEGKVLLGGGKGPALRPWLGIPRGALLKLDAGAHAAVALDRGSRYELAGPVVAVVGDTKVERRSGTGTVSAGGSPAGGSYRIGSAALPGRMMGGVLRSGGLEFAPSAPHYGSCEPAVRLSWTARINGIKELLVRLRSATTGKSHSETTLLPTTSSLILPTSTPRGVWLLVSLSARDEQSTVAETATWLRLATEAECKGYDALRSAADASPADGALALLAAERAIGLGLYDAARDRLKALTESQSDAPTLESAQLLKARTDREQERLARLLTGAR